MDHSYHLAVRFLHVITTLNSSSRHLCASPFLNCHRVSMVPYIPLIHTGSLRVFLTMIPCTQDTISPESNLTPTHTHCTILNDDCVLHPLGSHTESLGAECFSRTEVQRIMMMIRSTLAGVTAMYTAATEGVSQSGAPSHRASPRQCLVHLAVSQLRPLPIEMTSSHGQRRLPARQGLLISLSQPPVHHRSVKTVVAVTVAPAGGTPSMQWQQYRLNGITH
jgi:hypothetical protein